MNRKTMKNKLKITFRHGDSKTSYQVDDSEGHIDDVLDMFMTVLKGAGYQKETIENYWQRIGGVYNKIEK